MFSNENPHLVYVQVRGISTIGGIDVQTDRGYLLVGDHKNGGAGGGEDKHVVFNVQCLVFDVQYCNTEDNHVAIIICCTGGLGDLVRGD